MSCILVAYGYHVGLRNFIKFYFIPYLVRLLFICLANTPDYRVQSFRTT